MNRIAPFLAFLAVAAFAGLLSAQDRAKSKNARPLPLEGKPLPEVVAHDENGEAFPLRERLDGRPAVLVFGCLT